MEPEKPTTTHCGKIVIHLKNDDVGYPEDEPHNDFSIKQADYIPETGRNFFIFPEFQGQGNGRGGIDKRYKLNDIKIVATLDFSDGSVVGKSTLLPGIGQHTRIEIPYENKSKLAGIGYNIQGKGFYDCRFDTTGKLKELSNIHCETLGSAWVTPSSTWNYKGNLYVYVKYPYSDEKKDIFRTFFGALFDK